MPAQAQEQFQHLVFEGYDGLTIAFPNYFSDEKLEQIIQDDILPKIQEYKNNRDSISDKRFCKNYAPNSIGDRAVENLRGIRCVDGKVENPIYRKKLVEYPERPTCKTSDGRYYEIYNKCRLDKLAPNESGTRVQSINNVCRGIACNPSFIENLRY